jgi:hypothetical protein
LTERLRVRGCWLALVAALALTTLLLASSHPALAKTSHRRDSVKGDFTWDYYRHLTLDASKVRSSSDTATGTIELTYAGISGWLFKADIECLRVKRHGASIVARITIGATRQHDGVPVGRRDRQG